MDWNMKKAERGPAVVRREGQALDFLQGEGTAPGPLKLKPMALHSSWVEPSGRGA